MENVEKEVVFLRGFPRSGTNWMCNLLNLHPEISCKGEFHLQYFLNVMKNYLASPLGQGGCIVQKGKTNIIEQNLQKFIEQCIIDFCEDKSIVVDRTPIGLTNLLIEDRKYIIISRDGRDAILSWFYLMLKSKNDVVLKKYPEMRKNAELLESNPLYFEDNPYELLDCEEFFRMRAKAWNQRIMSDKRICKQADKGIINIDYLWLRYEDVHRDTEGQRMILYKFLGLNPDNANELNEITSPGFKKHNPMSHFRKGKIEQWKDYFNDKYDKWFMEEAGQAMRILGYL